MNQSRSPHNGADCHRHSIRHKSRKQEEHFRNAYAKHIRSFSETDSFMRQFLPGKVSKQHSKSNLLGRMSLSSAGLSNQPPRLRNDIIVVDSSGESRPGSSDESIANHSPIRQLDSGSPDNFGYFRIFDAGVFGPSFPGAGSPGGGEIFEDLNKNFLKLDLSDVNDNYPGRLSPVHVQSPAREQRARSPSTQTDTLNVPLVPLLTQDLEIATRIENDNYLRQPVCEPLAFSPSALPKDASNAPFVPLTSDEIENAAQIAPRQSSRSPSLQPIRSPVCDGPNLVPLRATELEITQESEASYSGRQTPVREQGACSPCVRTDSFDVSSASLASHEAEVDVRTEPSELSPAREQQRSKQQKFEVSAEVLAENYLLEGTEIEHPSDFCLSMYRCADHPFVQPFYCQTCCKPICKDCSVHCVCNHVTADLMDFLEIAQRQAEEVLVDAYEGIDALADDMENMGMDIAALDQRTKDSVTDLKFFTHRMWTAVEERERRLFKQITEARRWKYEYLQDKYINLKEDRNRLIQVITALKCAIQDSRSVACSPDELLKKKNMVLAEIWQINQSRKAKSRVGREENWISFKSSDSSVLHAIANGGAVLVNSPGTIGDHKISHEYKLQQYFPYGLNEMMMQTIPRGYAIAEYAYNIVLPNRALELYVKSTDVKIIGHFGEESPENLCRPWGITCDKEGNIIVSDRSNNRIQIFREDGTLARRFGSYGNGPCQFNRPAGIAVDVKRRLIVVDKDNHRIQILTMEGEFLRSFGEHGEKPGQFSYPWDVAVNSRCEIAVTDTRNHRVQLFSAEGVPLRMFGGQHLLRYLDSPRGICFNNDGKLIVTDFNNHHVLIIEYNMTDMRVLRCEREPRPGRRLEDGGGVENGDGQCDEGTPAFQRPQGVIAADDGSILVADSRHNAIKAYNSIGNLIYTYRPGQDEMDRPLGVALYADGRLAFTDYGRNYVRLVRLENHVNPVPRNAIMFG